MGFPDGFGGFFAAAQAAVEDVLTVKPEEVEAVIKKTRNQAADLLSVDFKDAKQHVSTDVFGSYEGAQVVVSAHTAAHNITQATLADVKKALEDFAESLRRALDSSGNADESSRAMLDGLAQINPGDAGQSTLENSQATEGFELNHEAPADEEGTS